MEEKKKFSVFILYLLSCNFCGVCGYNSPDDDRLSPFWVYFVYLGSSEFNAKASSDLVEKRITNAYLIAASHLKRFKNYSTVYSDSFEKHVVKVAKVKRLSDEGGEQVSFSVTDEQANYISASAIVQIFSHISYQDLAIILGVKLLQKPQIFDIEAYDEVDDYLWIIGAVFICVLAAILICWFVILAYLYFIRAEVLQHWIRQPLEKANNITQWNPEPGSSTQNEPPSIKPSDSVNSYSVIYCEASSSVIVRNSYQEPENLAKAKANLSMSPSNTVRRAHFLSPRTGHRNASFDDNDRLQHVNKPAILDISDEDIVPVVSQRIHQTQIVPPEPELLTACSTPVDVDYLRPIIIKQRAHPEAIGLVEMTLSSSNVHE